jgi:tetratricopeptide (TPR) repeat protein
MILTMRIGVYAFIVISLVGCMHNEIESTVSIERLRIQAQEHFKQSEFEIAIQLYDELSRATTLTLRDRYDFGRACYFQDQFQRADSLFASMQGKDPSSKISFLWRARVNAAIDSTVERGLALPYFKKLIEDPELKAQRFDLREAYQYLGYYYFTKGDNEQAKMCLTKVIELYPEDESLKFTLEMMGRKR